MLTAPDFTDDELQEITSILADQYGKDTEIQLADSEVILDDDSAVKTNCPSVFWHGGNANFLVIKTGVSKYRTQLFYTPHDQHGTGTKSYTNLRECVIAILQVQSDHQKQRRDSTH